MHKREHTANASAIHAFEFQFPFLLVRQQDLGLAGTIQVTESERLRKLSVR